MIGILVVLLSLYISSILASIAPEGHSRWGFSLTALGMAAILLFWREPFLEVIVRTNRLWGIHTHKRPMRIIMTLWGLAALILGVLVLFGLIPVRPRS